MIDKIWAFLLLVSIGFGIASGRVDILSSAVLDGASQAVTLVIGLTGVLCFWQGMMAVMRACGVAGALARLLRRPVGRLIPKTRRDAHAREAVCANISANLLGLSNAATPFGIEAAKALSDGSTIANNDLCMLVVINSASLQLIPSTVAALRASLGSAAPYDILPAVWVTTLVSQAVGVGMALLLSKRKSRRCDAHAPPGSSIRAQPAGRLLLPEERRRP